MKTRSRLEEGSRSEEESIPDKESSTLSVCDYLADIYSDLKDLNCKIGSLGASLGVHEKCSDTPLDDSAGEIFNTLILMKKLTGSSKETLRSIEDRIGS